MCPDYWGLQDGRVACRSLGYATGVGAIRYSFNVPQPADPDTPQWASGLQCVGNETSLEFCPRPWYYPVWHASCSLYSAAATICYNGRCARLRCCDAFWRQGARVFNGRFRERRAGEGSPAAGLFWCGVWTAPHWQGVHPAYDLLFCL